MLMKSRWLVLGVGLAVVAGMAGCSQKRTPKAKGDLKTIYFDFDKSDIKADYKDEMEGNAAYTKSHSKKISIEGHCDERGTNEYNIALGQRRANGAKSYLVSLGASGDSLSTVSFGEEKSVCSESVESCWWKNRRAEFLVK